MAVLRLERQSCMYGNKPVYDGIVEAADDLLTEQSNRIPFVGSMVYLPPGSLLYCLEDGSLYVKGSDGSWGAVE